MKHDGATAALHLPPGHALHADCFVCSSLASPGEPGDCSTAQCMDPPEQTIADFQDSEEKKVLNLKGKIVAELPIPSEELDAMRASVQARGYGVVQPSPGAWAGREGERWRTVRSPYACAHPAGLLHSLGQAHPPDLQECQHKHEHQRLVV